MNQITKKKGFTLIELLIVMAIIGLIISVSILSYASVNRRIALDITANRIENMIIEMREKTRSGYFEGDESLCFGFEVQKEATINQLKAPYNWLTKCSTIEAESYGVNDLNESIVIKDLKIFGEDVEDFTVFFEPPNAIIELGQRSINTENRFLQIVIGFEVETDERDKRVILLNMLTGNTITDKFDEKYQ